MIYGTDGAIRSWKTTAGGLMVVVTDTDAYTVVPVASCGGQLDPRGSELTLSGGTSVNAVPSSRPRSSSIVHGRPRSSSVSFRDSTLVTYPRVTRDWSHATVVAEMIAQGVFFRILSSRVVYGVFLKLPTDRGRSTP